MDDNKSKHEEMQFKVQKLRDEMSKPEVGVISTQEQNELMSVENEIKSIKSAIKNTDKQYYDLRSNIENINSEFKKTELSLNDTKTALANLNETNLIEKRNNLESQIKSSASQAERYQQNMTRQDQIIKELQPKLEKLKKDN